MREIIDQIVLFALVAAMVTLGLLLGRALRDPEPVCLHRQASHIETRCVQAFGMANHEVTCDNVEVAGNCDEWADGGAK